MGVAIHAFEWGFVRLAPFALVAALVGVFLTRKRAWNMFRERVPLNRKSSTTGQT